MYKYNNTLDNLVLILPTLFFLSKSFITRTDLSPKPLDEGEYGVKTFDE